MHDEDLYAAAVEGKSIEIDIPTRQIIIGGDKTFKFQRAEMEWRLTVNRGLCEAYKKFGKEIWQHMTQRGGATGGSDNVELSEGSSDNRLH